MQNQTEGFNQLKSQQPSMAAFVSEFLTLLTNTVQESVDKATKNLLSELNQQKQVSNVNEDPTEGYITREQVAELLHISYPTLHRYQCQGLIPVVRVGRKCLYNKNEVLTALKNVNRKKGKQMVKN